MNNPLYLLIGVTPWLVILCWQDCRWRRLPNSLTLGGALVALAWRWGTGEAVFGPGLVGGLVCGLFLLIPFYLRGAGGGDVKMLFAAGCALGLTRVPLLLFATSVGGVVLALVMLLGGWVSGARLKHCLRMVFDWRYDRKAGRAKLPPRSDEKSRVPFGVAIAFGVGATLVMELVGW